MGALNRKNTLLKYSKLLLGYVLSKVVCRWLVPRLVKSGKTALFWKKQVNEPFENVFMRTPRILGALNARDMLTESKELLFRYVWVKLYANS